MAIVPSIAFAKPRVILRTKRVLLFPERRQGMFYSSSVVLSGETFKAAVRGVGPGPFKWAAQIFDESIQQWKHITPVTTDHQITLTGVTGRVSFELDVPKHAILGIVEIG